MKQLLTLLLAFYAYSSHAEIKITGKYDSFSTKKVEKLKAPQLNSLAEATAWADLVAIAQISGLEYKKVRELNASGFGYLNVLLPYKGATKGEPIAVMAKGFDDNICYYPDGETEGERYLVFLKKAPVEFGNVYYGFKPFCQLQILLSDIGQYILRTPLDIESITIDPELIEEHQYRDAHALLDTTLWTGIKRQEYAENFHCEIIKSEDQFNTYFHLRYTQGVPLHKLRPLLKIKYVPRITSKQI